MIDLPREWNRTVIGILDEHLPECEILVFGSRVEGTAERYSDLDLVVRGLEESQWRRIESTKDAFSESDLPISVDLVRWEDLPGKTRQRIEGAHQKLRAPRHR